jgi:hypothetical protein
MRSSSRCLEYTTISITSNPRKIINTETVIGRRGQPGWGAAQSIASGTTIKMPIMSPIYQVHQLNPYSWCPMPPAHHKRDTPTVAPIKLLTGMTSAISLPTSRS